MTEKARLIRRAVLTHHGEVWDAEVGTSLSGKDRNGQPLSSSATVLAISPPYVITDGKGGMWHTRAQVDEIRAVEYFADGVAGTPSSRRPF